MWELDPEKIRPIRERGIFLSALRRAEVTDGQRIMAKILYGLVGLKPALNFVKYVKRRNNVSQ